MLTDNAIKKAKTTGKDYKLYDHDGLYVRVTAKGARYFRFDYTFAEKRGTMALGVYPAVTLVEARRRRDAARADIAAGRDPSEVKKAAKRALLRSATNTLEAIGKEWLYTRRTGLAANYVVEIESRLEANIFSTLGHRAIDQIEPLEILQAVQKIEKRRAHEMARKVLGDVARIYRFAIGTGRCKYNPASELRDTLQKPPKVKHHASMPVALLPSFYEKLNNYGGDPRTVMAIKLEMLTFIRTKEIRFARWSEFDLNTLKPAWNIPGERMKMKEDHVVPLAPQAVAVLEELRALPGSKSSDFLFPSRGKDRVLSSAAMLGALKRMGYNKIATVHGFRTLASTVLNEMGFNADAIERQLAHGERDKVRDAYNRAQYLDERRTMMLTWADYLDGMRDGKIVAIGARVTATATGK